MEYACRVDKHGWWRNFTRTAPPPAAPRIVSAGLLAFIFVWSNLVFALVLASAGGTQYGIIALAIVLSILPTPALAPYARRWPIKGLNLSTVKE